MIYGKNYKCSDELYNYINQLLLDDDLVMIGLYETHWIKELFNRLYHRSTDEQIRNWNSYP